MKQSASLSVESVFLESQLPWKPPRFQDSVSFAIRSCHLIWLHGVNKPGHTFVLKIKVLTS